MKFSDGRDEVTFGGKPHPEGEFLFQIEQGGVDYREAEDSKMKSLRVISESVKIVEAEEGTEAGDKMIDFIVLVTKKGEVNEMGEQRVVDYLKLTGLTEKFIERYGDKDVDFTDEKFIAALKLKLPGGKFVGRVYQKKDNNEVLRANFAKLYSPTMLSQTESGSTSKSSESGGDKAEGSGGDDW